MSPMLIDKYVNIYRERRICTDVWGEGMRSEELKEWKALSVGTGIEPQRNPTGLGLAISSFPTHWSSRDPSIDFAIDFFFLLLFAFYLYKLQTSLLSSLRFSVFSRTFAKLQISTVVSTFAYLVCYFLK